MTRSAMLDVLNQDYIRTADAKGLSRSYLILRHGLPNAMMPILTVTGIIAGALLGSAVVVEQVFSLPGVGRLIIGAILSRDFPVIQGGRSEEHTSELQSLMRISYAVFCLNKKK